MREGTLRRRKAPIAIAAVVALFGGITAFAAISRSDDPTPTPSAPPRVVGEVHRMAEPPPATYGIAPPAPITTEPVATPPVRMPQARAKIKDRLKLAPPTRGIGRAAPQLSAAAKLFRQGHVRDALALYGRITHRFPDDADGWFGVALCNFELRRDADAEAAAQRALVVDPAHALANLLAGFLAQEYADPAGARRHYERYLDSAPNGPYAEEILSVLDQLPRP